MLWEDMATPVPGIVAAVQRQLTTSLFVALIGYKEEQGTDKVAPSIWHVCLAWGVEESQVPQPLLLVVGWVHTS